MRYCTNCGRKRDEASILIKGYFLTQLMPYESLLCSECSLTQVDQTKALIEIKLSEKVVPKSRPRVTKNATFFPVTYTRWRDSASKEITECIRSRLKAEGKTTADLLPFDKVRPVAIFVDFFGSLRGNADLDNAIGSILDVFAFKGWCLQDDNVQRVPLISARFHPLPKATKKRPQHLRTEIRIYSLPPDLYSDFPETPKTPKTPANKISRLSKNLALSTP